MYGFVRITCETEGVGLLYKVVFCRFHLDLPSIGRFR